MDTSPFAALFGPPPSNPVPIDWPAVESWLGLTLPADYKAIASAYGPLDLGDRLWLHTPCAQPDAFDYGTWLTETHRSCRIAARTAPPHEPPPFHPAPGGLLAWGMTRNVEYLFWDTGAAEHPDEWPIVVFRQDAVHAGVDPWKTFPMPLARLLTEAVHTGLSLPAGGSLGPMRATAQRTAFLTEAGPWTQPGPTRGATATPDRRAALTDGTGLAALTALVPPPATPYLGDGSWDDLTRELGTALPAQYVALLNRYGAGCWKGWLNVISPLRDGGQHFVHATEDLLAGYRELRSEFPEYYPLATWPEPGGFLPFATSIDGDQVGWLTEGEPDGWPLVVVPRHADQGPPLEHGLVDTMLAWTRGRFTTDGFAGLDADDDPLDFATFEPWNDREYL